MRHILGFTWGSAADASDEEASAPHRPSLTPSAEAMQLAARLQAGFADAQKTVLVSATRRREGTTTLAAHLAAASALLSHEPVLAIDANTRHPGMHRLFDCSRGPGVTEFVEANADYETVVRPSSTPYLSVITAGAPTEHASESLSTEAFGRLIAESRERFPIIFIDTPSILEYADTAVVAQHADAAMLVASVGGPRRADIVEATRILEGLRVDVLGAVLCRH